MVVLLVENSPAAGHLTRKAFEALVKEIGDFRLTSAGLLLHTLDVR